MTFAVLFVAVLLLLGVILRQNVSLFRWLFIPASVIAGFIGLASIQIPLLAADPELTTPIEDLRKMLSGWPGFLIAVVFAGMLMERSGGGWRQRINRVGKQGLMVWIIVLGETAVGLWATWLLIQPRWEVPNSFGMLIETGFAGGHGTAGAMGQVFAHPTIDFPSGQDLGVLMATCGLVYGVVSGIGWINFAARLGWISRPNDTHESEPERPLRDESNANEKLSPSVQPSPIGFQRISRDTIDPLLLQIIWLALAFGIGWAMQTAVLTIAGYLDGVFVSVDAGDAAQEELAKRLTFSSVMDFPLFIYTLFGGFIVRSTLGLVGQSDKLDGETINRLTTTAMEILVVAAIASLNLTAVATLLGPFTILLVAGALWTAVCLLVISRWVLPSDCWFHLGLINYGMSTGTTATGFVLLQVVDPELDSEAAEDYALAAPLSSPFIGGGLVTVGLPLLLLERVSLGIPAITLAAIVATLIVIGKRWNRTG